MHIDLYTHSLFLFAIKLVQLFVYTSEYDTEAICAPSHGNCEMWHDSCF